MRTFVAFIGILTVVAAGCASGEGSDGVGAPLPTADGVVSTRPVQPENEPGDTPAPGYGDTNDFPGVESPRSVVKPTAPVFGEGEVVIDERLADLIDQAILDVSNHLGADPSDVSIVSAESVVWPDGSIGCPQPGMLYAQVQVDGVRIVLAVDNELYAYHSGGQRGLFLCQ